MRESNSTGGKRIIRTKRTGPETQMCTWITGSFPTTRVLILSKQPAPSQDQQKRSKTAEGGNRIIIIIEIIIIMVMKFIRIIIRRII